MIDYKFASIVLCCLLLASCGGKHSDLSEYFDEVRARPAGEVEPLPEYPPYKPYNYLAMNMRAPFERPQNIVEIKVDFTPNIKPIVDRARQPLEAFSIDTLTMVGGLARNEEVWGLILDPNGRVHRVAVGDYLGLNNGKVTEIHESFVAFMELVPAGENRWRERPRSLRLESLEQ